MGDTMLYIFIFLIIALMITLWSFLKVASLCDEEEEKMIAKNH